MAGHRKGSSGTKSETQQESHTMRALGREEYKLLTASKLFPTLRFFSPMREVPRFLKQ
jgi:hypothetical protein